MSDRELLELAAKAAGITLKPMEVRNVEYQGDDRFIGYMTNPAEWSRGWFNPLTDDGDALRLAVKLRLKIQITDNGAAVRLGFTNLSLVALDESPDVEAATRRAIVRAAAEIGRAMA